MTLGVDYAWTHPDPASIKTGGYDFAVRYLSTDPAKDLSRSEAAALHAAGVAVLLVWETTARRAGAGKAAGAADRATAERRAAALGYPPGCPIFYAVDFDATPGQVTPYFQGVSASGSTHGVYGSLRVVDAILGADLADYGWQTQAWSGLTVSHRAHLYQRVRHTRPPLPGVPAGSYDENALLRPVPMWTGRAPHVVLHPTSPLTLKGHPPMGIARVPGTGHEWLVRLGDNGSYIVRHLSGPEATFWRSCGVGQSDVDAEQAAALGVS